MLVTLALVGGLCAACTPCQQAAFAGHVSHHRQEDDPEIVAEFARCQQDGLICSIERGQDGNLEVIGRERTIGTAITAHG